MRKALNMAVLVSILVTSVNAGFISKGYKLVKTIFISSSKKVSKKRLLKITKDSAKKKKNYIKSYDKTNKNNFNKLKSNYKNKLMYLKPNFNQEFIKTLPNKIGVYIVRKNGKIVYIGRAIEQRPSQSTSGLRKRLMEHYRGDKNGNTLIYKNRNRINIEYITTDSVKKTKELEAKLIKKYNTVEKGWNKRYENIK